MPDPKWKKGHPGVPAHWTGLGSGGHADVWADGDLAIKRLRPGASEEARLRYRRESELVQTLRDDASLAIVPIVEVREREGSTEIVMQRMDCCLDDQLPRYRGNPAEAAAALVPVVRTLIALSKRNPAIHHRDLKPSNLLVRTQREQAPELFLADFGCAYVAGDSRLTPVARAVGAWAFRPPEYSGGFVAQVTEKGDVYSLGKILWCMINGERRVVFPETLWYLHDYDLRQRFGASQAIIRASLLIGGAASALPEKRPSLEQLLESLSILANRDQTIRTEDPRMLDLLRAEKAAEAQTRANAALDAEFVRLMTGDLGAAFARLAADNPQSGLLRTWSNDYVQAPPRVARVEYLVSQVTDHGSDVVVAYSRFLRCVLTAQLHPRKPAESAYLRITVHMAGESRLAEWTVAGNPTGLAVHWHLPTNEQAYEAYDGESIHRFLRDAAVTVFRS